MIAHLGMGWAAVAAAADVLKAMLLVLAAQHWGRLPDAWLAALGVAVVGGHSFPFYRRQMAGRGVAAAAGVFLAVLPVEMVICGLLIVAGTLLRATSLATTLGLASVPVAASIRGQPGPLVAMAVVIFAVILIRRLEGLGEVIRAGASPARAALYRGVFDSSGRPRRRSPGAP
jgi:glycerol-3-phosphate acyltransferase PlsY